MITDQVMEMYRKALLSQMKLREAKIRYNELAPEGARMIKDEKYKKLDVSRLMLWHSVVCALCDDVASCTSVNKKLLADSIIDLIADEAGDDIFESLGLNEED